MRYLFFMLFFINQLAFSQTDKKDYDTFAQKYPMNGELKEQNDKIIAMRQWCDKMKIRATPTIYINGKELPESYSIAELKNFY